MKKWKKTKRQRRRYRERKLVIIKIENISKDALLLLRSKSQRLNKSINKIIQGYIINYAKENSSKGI
jgi:hypothetical protein